MKTSPVMIVAIVLLVCHSFYTLWVMRIAVERPLGSAPERCIDILERKLNSTRMSGAGHDPGQNNKGKIAVVRPFIPAHVDWMVKDFEDWSKPEFAPCKLQERQEGSRVDRLLADQEKPDLVLYFSYPLNDFPDVVRILRNAWTDAPWRGCFARVRFISAGLNASADRYLPNQKFANSTKQDVEEKRHAPSGVVLMYYNLMLDPDFYNTYEYFLYMEPDLTAIRPGWLDQLKRECHNELHNFWMKGSIYAGPKYVSDQTDTPWMFHINGNAIYHVGDPEFRSYVKQVRQIEGALTNPFDVTMYEFRRTRFTLSQRTIHLFRYGEYIQNYGVSGYSLRKLLEDKPNTYLVHKKHQCPECDPVEP